VILFTFRSGLKGDYEFPERKVMFSSKMDSDLFEFVKHKTHAISIIVSPDGKMFAAMSNDKKVRVFRFLSGQIPHEFFNASCSFKTWPNLASLNATFSGLLNESEIAVSFDYLNCKMSYFLPLST
jgi:hypothetical protein